VSALAGLIEMVVALLHTHALAPLAARGVLPAPFAHTFLARALIAVALVTPVFGLLSVLVTARRLAFFSTALGQTALVGIAVGIWLGEPLTAPWGGLFGTTAAAALLLVFLRRHGRLGTDTLTGVFLAVSLALGVAVLVVVTRRFNVHQVEAVLFGNPLTVSDDDLAVLLVVGAVAAALVVRFARPVLLAAVDEGLAAARFGAGRVGLLDYGLAVGLAAAVVVALPVVGALLVEGLVVVPAAAARLFGHSLRAVFTGSVALSLLAGLVGLLTSAVTPIPAGAAIVLVLALFFILGQLRALVVR
jgi:zinc transport system permease protein